MIFILSVVYLSLIVVIYAQPDGWKMTDRFYGFRYELFGDGLDFATVLESIQQEADAFACFGWVQKSLSNTIVGEGRCSKSRGKAFQEKVEKQPGITKSDVLVYEDTKIRLHFSSFKILPQDRETCFLDAPHQCKEFTKPERTSPITESGRAEEL